MIKTITKFITIFILLPGFLFVAASPALADAFRISDWTGDVIARTNKPLTLNECYILALKQSEIIAINSQLIKEAEAHFVQALSIVLPHLSYSSVDTREDATNLSSIYPKNSYERKFVLTQNLFTGFKAMAGIAGSKLEQNQRFAEKMRAEQLLFLDVSDSFFLLLAQEEDLKTLQIIQEALINRMKELKAREDLGRSRHSESVNTEAELHRIEAEIKLVIGRKQVARQLLEFLTGRGISGVIDQKNFIPSLRPENEYLVRSTQRLDIEAARLAWEVGKQKVLIAKSGFLPTIDVEANYYTARNTAPSDSKWDALLDIEVPIFDGAQTIGNVMEANSRLRVNELEYLRLKRVAVRETRNAYVRLKENIASTKAYYKALTSAVENYHLQKEDYRLNLVSNLDVLDSIRRMGDSRRDFITSLYQTKTLYYRLFVAIGEIPVDNKR